jgi:hypothetical protein
MLATELPKRGLPWIPTFGQVAAVISLLGLGSLCFIAGAATMHSGGTAAKPLSEALTEAKIWFDDSPLSHHGERQPPGLSICNEALAFDGFTLVTTNEGAQCRLYDRAGTVVRGWTMPRGVPGLNDKGPINWEQCHLYPNGDLLAICCPSGDSPYGFGVVKVDKNSKLLWHHSGHFHHDLEVGDNGRIFLFETITLAKRPPELESLPEESKDERVVVLSPEGEEVQSFSLLGSFLGTPYLEILLSVNGVDNEPGMHIAGMPHAPFAGMPFPQTLPQSAGNSNPAMPALTPRMTDILHANSLRVLRVPVASKFPLFKAGQLLISLNTPSLLVVVDLDRQAIVWAAKGSWRHQHDAQFLYNGHILLFDNMGSPLGSRVLEYDPTTYAIPWSSGGTRETTFRASFRGRCQRLPNGNTRITDPQNRIFEVTPSKEVVWQLGLPSGEENTIRSITGSTVYSRDELSFLK